uniref:Uncharacterized protein n=1 Tax=Anopheles farauti TaxID=69004 RepID=A0A182QUX1_9DIPT
MLKDFGNNILISAEFFHSPLGNNQFSHTPYRLPLLGACDFHRFVMADFREHFEVETIENFPLDVQCPIKARTIIYNGVVLKSTNFPANVRPGLWKASVKLFEVLNDKNCDLDVDIVIEI